MFWKAGTVGLLVLVLGAAGCTAGKVATLPDTSRVRVGSQPPGGLNEQLGAITAKHGGGCGLYGARGSYEGAFTLLRNKAAELGADYVQILRVTEPRMEGICLSQAFVIDGMAYRIIERSSASPPPSAGLSGTFSGEIAGIQGSKPFTMRVTFTLVQTGDQVAGTWNTTGDTSGMVTATVAERRLLDFRARQINPCVGEFKGAAVIEAENSRLRGTYIGSGCGITVNASFVVDRQ